MNAKFTFRFVAGALIRSRMRFEIESYCDRHDLECKITENKGLLESHFQVTIGGNDETQVAEARAAIIEWVRKIGSDA